MDPEKHTLLLYEYVDDIIERRGPYRDAHLALLPQLKDSGTVLMAGSLGDPVTGAAIVFNPCDGLVLPQLPRRRVEPLTIDQVQAIYGVVPDQYRALIAVAVGTGLR